MKKLSLALVASLAALLAVPAGALALDIGSTQLGSSADQTQVCSTPSSTCIGTQEKIDGDFSINVVPDGYGVLTSFRFQSDSSLALVILRQTGPSSFSRVNFTNSVPGSGLNSIAEYFTRISVQPGDFIGVRIPAGGRIGALSASGDTNAWEMTDAASPALVANDPLEILLDATVEPDRDGDGYGDDTQDPDGGFPDDGGGGGGGGGDPVPDDGGGSTPATPAPDPLAPLRAGKRPGGRILGKSYKVSKKGVVKVKIKNTNGFTIRGKLSLRAKGLRMGSKSFRIGANGSKWVRIKLTRRARRTLARRRKMKARATATFRGPIGKSRTVKKTLTLKAPKRKKKRRRSSGGGGGGTTPGINPCGTPVYEPGYTDSYGVFHPGQMNWCPGLY